jgi:diguanylate cyclase (GGDEF)-like protein
VKLDSSFQTRIAVVFALLLLAVVGCLYLSVKLVTDTAVKARAGEQLQVGARVFERLLDVRGRQLRDAVTVLTSDYGFKEAVSSGDVATIRSVLGNHGARINASEVFLLSMDGRIEASTISSIAEGERFRFSEALADVRRKGQFIFVAPLNGEAHLLVESQVLAPIPIARVVMGFRMDESFANELRSLTGLDVSLLAIENGTPGTLVSSLGLSAQARELLQRQMLESQALEQLPFDLDRRHYLSEFVVLAANADAQVVALLHTSLDDAVKAFSALDRNILWISVGALLISMMGALALARSLSLPIRELARAAARVGQGNYQEPIELRRDDELGRLAQTFRDMQAGIAERERQLAHNALHDAVTGLPNRGLLLERIANSTAAERPLALLCIGIRNLAAASQPFGGAALERMLVLFSQRLKAAMKPGDSLARVSADEFVLLLEGADSDSSVALGYQIQPMLSLPLLLDGEEIKLFCNLGIATYPADGQNADELLRRANIAMQDADGQPARLQLYQQGRDDAHRRQLDLIRDLRQASQQGNLSLVYQPKLDLETGGFKKAEALLRWQHPNYGPVSPGEFIPLAERTGSIQLLTGWVIEEAIRQLAEWNTRGLRVQLSLNISAEDLAAADLTERVRRQLRQHQLPPEQLIFEITESAMMGDQQLALKTLHALRDLGISLSVDDFGTGYSSLAQLKRMPVQELKIDQSFIRDLDETSEDAVIVRSTIEMSHSLGLKVVAEGVEYERSLLLLRRWKCDSVQGYLISRPLAAQAFERWIAEHLPLPASLVH